MQRARLAGVMASVLLVLGAAAAPDAAAVCSWTDPNSGTSFDLSPLRKPAGSS